MSNGGAEVHVVGRRVAARVGGAAKGRIGPGEKVLEPQEPAAVQKLRKEWAGRSREASGRANVCALALYPMPSRRRAAAPRAGCLAFREGTARWPDNQPAETLLLSSGNTPAGQSLALRRLYRFGHLFQGRWRSLSKIYIRRHHLKCFLKIINSG
jgi:hypothetical protein